MIAKAGKPRPVVLTFVRHYLPGYKAGGPIQTIANLVEALGDDIEFKIVTTDRDSSDRAPYNQVIAGEWQSVGKAKVLYVPPGWMTIANVGRLLRSVPCDTVYLNSFFDPTFSLVPLLANWLGLAPRKRIIVAPRGEFSPNALRLKLIKKQAFMGLSRALGLHRNLVWQASTHREAADIRAALGDAGAEIRIAADLAVASMVSNEVMSRAPAAADAPLRIVFLSRISPMKNLEFALEILKSVKVPILFDIYGPVSDGEYWGRCRARIKELPKNIVASYHGAVEHHAVSSLIAGYDLFFLPTLGENFGHVILEALAAGTPALISDATPWNDMADAGAGWVLPLNTIEPFVQTLHLVSGFTPDEHLRMRIKARAYAGKRVADRVAVEANRQLFSASAL